MNYSWDFSHSNFPILQPSPFYIPNLLCYLCAITRSRSVIAPRRQSILISITGEAILPLVHDWLALTTRRRRAPKMIQKERRSYSIVSCNTGFIMSLSHNQNDAFQVRPDCTNCQAVRHQAWSSWTQANLPRT